MSTNVFANLGLPVLNGAGTAVDVSTMGPLKTIVINGSFEGCTIEIQASQVAGGASGFAPVCSFTDGDTHKVVEVAARYLRTFVRNRVAGATFTANVDVGAPVWVNEYASITMPGADGDGASIDVSALGSLWTVNMTGEFAGARVMLEVSEDNVAWSPLVSFTGPGQRTFRVSAQRARVNLLGFTAAFTATCQIGAADDPEAPGTPGTVASNCYVYKPGSGATGPVVWDDFDDLYAALDAQRTANGGGCYSIEIDDSITSPAVMGTAVTYDMTSVQWVGAKRTALQATCTMPDGAAYTGLRVFRNLVVTNLNTTTSPLTGVVAGDQFILENTTLQTTTGVTVPMIAYSGINNPNAVTIWVLEGSTLGGSETGRVINGAGSAQLRLKLDALSAITVPAAISCTGGTPVLVVTAPSMAQIPGLFTNWSGIYATGPGAVLPTPMSLRPLPFLQAPSTIAVAAAMGYWLRLTSSGGTFVQTLPAIDGATFTAPGTLLLLTDPTSNNGTPIEFAAAGTDTINGSAAHQFVPGGGAMLLISNGRPTGGVGDWSIVAVYGNDRVMVPDLFKVDNIAANTPSTVLPTVLSVNNVWQPPRPGAITAIAVRLSAPVTQGSITVTATVGGIAGTLQAVITAGNQGANVTQPAGSHDNFTVAVAAGIGLRYESSADLLPDGTIDLEATVEAAMCGLAA